jgi:hypothetical protein
MSKPRPFCPKFELQPKLNRNYSLFVDGGVPYVLINPNGYFDVGDYGCESSPPSYFMSDRKPLVGEKYVPVFYGRSGIEGCEHVGFVIVDKNGRASNDVLYPMSPDEGAAWMSDRWSMLDADGFVYVGEVGSDKAIGSFTPNGTWVPN